MEGEGKLIRALHRYCTTGFSELVNKTGKVKIDKESESPAKTAKERTAANAFKVQIPWLSGLFLRKLTGVGTTRLGIGE